ncbi:MAG: TIM barrel protein [Clostridia bacterium]|nr:TIM barrel protein [Clostridia bacterium]
MKFSVCIDMMYPEADIAGRCEITKQVGAQAVEFWKWTNKDIPALAEKLRELGIGAALMNLDSADEALSAALMRGILSHRRIDDFIRAIHETAPVMRQLGMENCIVLAGDVDDEIPLEQAFENIRDTLAAGAKAASDEGINLLLEPLNTYDRPSYVLPWSAPSFDILRDVNSPNVKLLLDLYHTQRMEGNLIDTMMKNIDLIGHFHVAGSPWRCEPSLGEVDYMQVFDAIEAVGYEGYVGFEYRVRKTSFDLGEYIRKYRGR